MMKKYIFIALTLFYFTAGFSQIRIVSMTQGYDYGGGIGFIPSDMIIKNFGATPVDVSDYWLSCNLIDTQINTLTSNTSGGGYVIAPGSVISLLGLSAVYESFNNIAVSLHVSNNFNSTTDLVDFVQFAYPAIPFSGGRESVAVAKGIWVSGTSASEGGHHTFNGGATDYGAEFWSAGVFLSVSEFESNSIKIHPNPVESFLRIETKHTDLKVVVFDLLGKLVLKTQGVNQIDVSKLNSGIYLVKFENSEGQSLVKKIIKI